jgi:tetratricopeptide (TPR) repeat protein
MQFGRTCALVLILSLPAAAAMAEDYWTYTYNNIEVTTFVSGAHAVSLAHNLERFDQALTRVLSLPERRVPTAIFEVPPERGAAMTGQTEGASMRFTGYEVTVVNVTKSSVPRAIWGTLFGYCSGLLESGRVSRTPYWFQRGVPTVFANTEFDSQHVRTGGTEPGYAQRLGGKLIPMRTLLNVQASDPQLRDPQFAEMFAAQSWFLAKEVYVEHKQRSEFAEYLTRMRHGQTEAEAFSTSFKISYEDLDKMLVAAFREPAHMYVVDVPDLPSGNEPARKLTGAEVKTMLAQLSLQWQHRADALRLATEALQADPADELALRVLARGYLQDGNFAGSLAAVDKLTPTQRASAAALTDSGDVLSRLAYEVSAKQASVGTDADALRTRAKDAYERAISVDPEFLRAWSGLAYLYSSQRDAAAAKSLADRARPVMEKHPDNGALARALAIMCGQTAQADCAFLYGEYWSNNALTQKDLGDAKALLIRMHGQ